MTKRDDSGPKRLKDSEIINVERRQLLTGLTALGVVGGVVLTGSTAYAANLCDAAQSVNVVLQRIATAKAEDRNYVVVPMLDIERTVSLAKAGLNATGSGSDWVTNDTDPGDPVTVGDCND